MAEETSTKRVFMHGDLDIKIIAARRLPNKDIATSRISRCFTCDAGSSSSSHPSPKNKTRALGKASAVAQQHRRIITSDPYAAVVVSGSEAALARTRVIANCQNPEWDEQFLIPMAHPISTLEIQVKDDDVFGADLIGIVTFPAARISSGEELSGWFPILDSSGKSPKPDTAIEIEMRFTACEINPKYGQGMGGGVSGTYFPLRKGNSLTLYQDAHGSSLIPSDIKLDLEEDGEAVYKQENCWEDICYAITEAHHLIYLVGWSVFHKVRLVREPTRDLPKGGDLTLGELLKYKSEEGVRVLILVWDDKTSHNNRFIKTQGVMQTHDEETRKFFKHSSVTCVMSPRYASNKLSYFKQQVVGTLYTHHQKCVLVDQKANDNDDRMITAFMGGLDLCDGRYDTPEHRIFRDLDTIFKDDFHNPTFPEGTKAPRQPWHDLHCKIQGPAAYDVLMNFEQRWKKATRWKEVGLRKKMSRRHDALIKIDRISWILSPERVVSGGNDTSRVPGEDPNLWVFKEDHPQNWHVQVFRSIDSGSVKGFPKAVDLAKAQNLECSKNLVIDKSIQTAYIQAIRSAQNFIYIENQYFLGSSYAWPSYKNAGADNLIPMELALKIVSKIRANERFVVYIIIPMWPEGDPKSAPVQEILYWQGQTMQMMYDIIASELKYKKVTDVSPQDYLSFYCLGKREEIDEDLSKETNHHQGDKISDSYKFRRFMIYVHSKGMIVDDEYLIIGSANINQRSLDGSKDTEIAMGAHQPHHTWANKNRHPRGQVYGYRSSLWAEHLGTLHEHFKFPESLECVRLVNQIAEDNWNKFSAEKFMTLQGHLLKYPVQIDVDGKVKILPNQDSFPDVGGKIHGAHSTALPDALTT